MPLRKDELFYISDEWYKQGLKEHASIASFSANGLKLLSIGSPSYLLIDNYKASLDEINHAKICFTLSKHYKDMAIAIGNENDENNDNNSIRMPSSFDAHSVDI